VRCLTRRPDSEAAKTLKQLGAEVVRADLDDPGQPQVGTERLHGRFPASLIFGKPFCENTTRVVNLIDAAFGSGSRAPRAQDSSQCCEDKERTTANIWVLPRRQHGLFAAETQRRYRHSSSDCLWSGQCQSLPYGLPAVACPPKSAFLSGTGRRLSRSVPSLTATS